MEKLAIMNYITQEVHIFEVDTDHEIELSDLGFRESDCHWMFGEDIPVIYHKEVLKWQSINVELRSIGKTGTGIEVAEIKSSTPGK